MGISSTLWEEILLDEGRVLNPSFTDYKILNATIIPKLENFKSFIAPSPHRSGPYGAKGMGGVVLMPTAPALANAIYNAVGVRIMDLPLNKEKILRALEENRKT